ncbi:ASCH domain-containing protein [Microbacterium karelineae]|uniref:ASCH domain-containing protein n=1 Tax=Microbacterium karelineae TaxID=2654283 RepID=UPI0012EA9EE6|nr:ASCH domain-containing protein [Microbacterium karelineae]
MTASPDIAEFWRAARAAVPTLPADPPPADRVWGFGATPEHADGLLALVLDGTKTGTASDLWGYEADGDPLPQLGQLDVILDGSGAPRAVLQNTSVEIVPFRDVTEEHAFSEGEDDRTLASWRRIHEDFFTRYASHDRGFRDDMPIVCERFRLVYAG